MQFEPGGPCARQTLDEIVDMMASLKPVVKLQKAWDDAGAHGHMPPQYVKREIIKGTLAPIGRFGGPLPTRTNASTLYLYGAGLSVFLPWQVRPTAGSWGQVRFRVVGCSGMCNGPLPMRTNASMLHLFGVWLAPFLPWQMGPTSGLWGRVHFRLVGSSPRQVCGVRGQVERPAG